MPNALNVLNVNKDNTVTNINRFSRSPIASTAENTLDEFYNNRNIEDNSKSLVFVQPHVSSSIVGAKNMASMTKEEAKLNKKFMDPGKSGYNFKNSN